MQLSEEQDRLIDILLQEVLGGEAPPELSGKILSRAFARARRIIGRLAAAAAGLLIGVLGWLLLSGGYPEPRASGSYTVVEGGEARRGATLRTLDQSAKVTLGGYCRVELEADTALRIEGKARAEQVALQRGGVLCDVNRAAGTFEVRTEIGTVSVKGTRFTVRLIEGNGGEAMVGSRLWVRVLAGVVLVSGAWGETTLYAGEERRLPERERERKAEPEKRPEKPGYAPLLEGIRGFRGHLIGNLLSVGSKGCTMEVASVRPIEGSKAREGDCLVGQKVPIHFMAQRGADGEFRPNRDLAELAARQLKKGGLCTLRVRADGDEALVMDRIWTGAQANPEGLARPRPEGERKREGMPEGERKREGEREAEPKRDIKREGEPKGEGDLENWLEGQRKREGEREGERKPEGSREGERRPEGERKRDVKPEGEREPERKRDVKPEGDREAAREREIRERKEREAERKREGNPEGERKREGKGDREGGGKEGDRNEHQEGKEGKNEDTNF